MVTFNYLQLQMSLQSQPLLKITVSYRHTYVNHQFNDNEMTPVCKLSDWHVNNKASLFLRTVRLNDVNNKAKQWQRGERRKEKLRVASLSASLLIWACVTNSASSLVWMHGSSLLMSHSTRIARHQGTVSICSLTLGHVSSAKKNYRVWSETVCRNYIHPRGWIQVLQGYFVFVTIAYPSSFMWEVQPKTLFPVWLPCVIKQM